MDAEGCQVLFEATKKTLILEGVNFETGKAELTPESQTILDGVAESLRGQRRASRSRWTATPTTPARAAVNKRLSQRGRRPCGST